MGRAKVLLLYISEHSGHHCAAIAIENALQRLDPAVETLSINSFNYTNPILEKVINRVYMSVLKNRPEIWDYLYDNPKILKKTQGLRAMIHKFNEGKLKALLDEFKPDVIACTQAFPCGMIADCKKSYKIPTPLVAVLTDYAPHSYWIYNNVDTYVVPSEATGRKLVDNGISPERIMRFGIPVDPKFKESHTRSALCASLGLDDKIPSVLVMGGTQGLGPIKELVWLLDRFGMDLQLIIATGSNDKLYNWLKRRRFRKRALILANAKNVDELMEVSKMIITKPGGMTTAEALAKGIPMLIVNPLPGQEVMNTKFLLREGVAVKAESPQDVVILVEELLYHSNKLNEMSARARALSKPDSAMDIARLILELAGK